MSRNTILFFKGPMKRGVSVVSRILKSSIKGFTLLEMMLAIAIFSLIFGVFIGLLTMAIKVDQQNLNDFESDNLLSAVVWDIQNHKRIQDRDFLILKSSEIKSGDKINEILINSLGEHVQNLNQASYVISCAQISEDPKIIYVSVVSLIQKENKNNKSMAYVVVDEN